MNRGVSNTPLIRLREWLAFLIAPWLRVRYSEHYDRALGDLAEVAYGSREAIWTSSTTLVDVALRRQREAVRAPFFIGKWPT